MDSIGDEMMIEVKNISKKFNEETILDFKDLTFKNGKSYVILGPSRFTEKLHYLTLLLE